MVKKLLIAEDNKFTAIQYKKFFEANGYDVDIFNNGLICLQKFENELRYRKIVLKDKTPPYDYVLLDHDMPKMTGAEVSQKIHKQCPRQRIIFLSAYGQSIIQFNESTRDEFLQIVQKPFSLDFLLRKITPKTFSGILRTKENAAVFTATQSPETIR